MATHHDIPDEDLIAIVNGLQGRNQDAARLLIVMQQNVTRLMRSLDGNGVKGLLQRQADTDLELALVKQRQEECPARNRRWLAVIGILLAAGSALVSTAITLYTVVNNAPHP